MTLRPKIIWNFLFSIERGRVGWEGEGEGEGVRCCVTFTHQDLGHSDIIHIETVRILRQD